MRTGDSFPSEVFDELRVFDSDNGANDTLVAATAAGIVTCSPAATAAATTPSCLLLLLRRRRRRLLLLLLLLLDDAATTHYSVAQTLSVRGYATTEKRLYHLQFLLPVG